MTALLLRRRARRRCNVLWPLSSSAVPAESYCGGRERLAARRRLLAVPEWPCAAESGRPSSPPSMFSLFSVCLWLVRDLEGNRGMSWLKECTGPQWPEDAVLHSSSATSAKKQNETKHALLNALRCFCYIPLSITLDLTFELIKSRICATVLYLQRC